MKLAAYFQDDMVIQRSKPIRIFGSCEKNEEISIRLFKNGVLLYEDKQVFTDVYCFIGPELLSDQGTIDIYLTSGNQNESFVAYIGDVFLLTGQSNMAYSFYVTDDYPQQAKECLQEYPIRYLNLGDSGVIEDGFVRSLNPLGDIDNSKKWFGNKNIAKRDVFSAIGVIFAHEYYKKHKIPVGLVNVSVGGSSIDSFLPEDVVFSDSKISEYLIEKNKIDINNVIEKSYTQTAGIYNEKISPLKGLYWKAIFWYQGEHHVGDAQDAEYYTYSLRVMINTYREMFDDNKLEFGCIQIANNYYPHDKGYGIPLINEAIQDAVFSLDSTFIVPLYDIEIKWKNERIGDNAMLIHPTNKKEVAIRLFQLFEDNSLSPYIDHYQIKGSQIYITMKNSKKGLKTSDKLNVQGFTISDETGRYYKADAYILDNETIMIENEHIKNPTDFMYAFYLYNIDANIVNSEGYPLLIYRSNRSHIDEKQLLSYHPVFDITHEHVLELGFFPLIANPGVKRRFVKGQINLTGRMTINVLNHKHIACRFFTNNKELNFFGISPNINLCGTRLRLFPEDVCDFVYESNSSELVFSGILLKTSDNDIVQLPVVFTEKRNADYHAVVKLDKAFNADLTSLKITKSFLNSVKELQFVFETKTDVEVIIKKIDFYKGV